MVSDLDLQRDLRPFREANGLERIDTEEPGEREHEAGLLCFNRPCWIEQCALQIVTEIALAFVPPLAAATRVGGEAKLLIDLFYESEPARFLQCVAEKRCRRLAILVRAAAAQG